MNCKIFISHSSLDKEVASLLVNFLTDGLGISDKEIFCSSIAGLDIPIGTNFNNYILEKIRQSSGFYTIVIISNTYYNSKYCIYELGAAWGLSGGSEKIIPFIVGNMDRGGPKDFIQFNQSVLGHDINNIFSMSDGFKNDKTIKMKSIPSEKFNSEVNKLIEGVKNYNQNKGKGNQSNYQNRSNIKIKLVAFDFDGVILQGKNYKHSWIAIWKYLRYPMTIRKELQEKHRKNPHQYTFKNWCDDCVKYFIEADFQKEYVKKIIESNDLSVAPNFNELVKLLHTFGIKIIIISGGIDTFIEEAIDDATLDLIDEVFVNRFIYNKNGQLEGVIPYHQSNESDGVAKIKALDTYCEKNNIQREDVAYIGDHINDIDILQIVGKPIVYPVQNDSSPEMTSKEMGFELIHQDSILYTIQKILN